MAYKTKQQRIEEATMTLVHAKNYICRALEFSPANGQAARILECLAAEISR